MTYICQVCSVNSQFTPHGLTFLGALVLGHSLRDAGAKKKLAVFVADDSVSADAITELKV